MTNYKVPWEDWNQKWESCKPQVTLRSPLQTYVYKKRREVCGHPLTNHYPLKRMSQKISKLWARELDLPPWGATRKKEMPVRSGKAHQNVDPTNEMNGRNAKWRYLVRVIKDHCPLAPASGRSLSSLKDMLDDPDVFIVFFLSSSTTCFSILFLFMW